ncbi:protein of unknown function [Xenorhabdus doucetiae]|uniref:Uncharacterized protein n=1 Tax=Xenorhabdus doucetiae TaxID=351671 RepID=A0A068QZQ1_9GAMM|nr:protein of unknown function [Xenorhabdus doucetiae]
MLVTGEYVKIRFYIRFEGVCYQPLNLTDDYEKKPFSPDFKQKNRRIHQK